MMTGLEGSFVWYELMTTGVQAAAAFYQDVVGWTAVDTGMDYTILNAGAFPAAGLLDMPAEARANGAPIGWSGYIGVDDVDAAVIAVTKAGGSVHKAAFDVPEVGRLAVVADPQHAAFVLFKPSASRPEAPPPNTPGLGGWHELHVDDMPAAFGFYSTVFGWTKADAIDMGPMGTYQLFTISSTQAGGMMTRQPVMPRPTWLYYFIVAGIDAAAARVKAAGGEVVNGPHPVPGGSQILHGRDPQGAMFALVQPAG